MKLYRIRASSTKLIKAIERPGLSSLFCHSPHVPTKSFLVVFPRAADAIYFASHGSLSIAVSAVELVQAVISSEVDLLAVL